MNAMAEMVVVLQQAVTQAVEVGDLPDAAGLYVGRLAKMLDRRVRRRQRCITTFGQSLRCVAELFDILDHEAGVGTGGMEIRDASGLVMTVEELFPHLTRVG